LGYDLLEEQLGVGVYHFCGGVVQFEVLEGDVGYVVALERGEEFEAAISEGEFFGFWAWVVAVLLGESDAVVDLVDLLGGICWAGHFDLDGRWVLGKG
jgi:hypothetical protein